MDVLCWWCNSSGAVARMVSGITVYVPCPECHELRRRELERQKAARAEQRGAVEGE